MAYPKETHWQPGQSGNPRGVKPGTIRGPYKKRKRITLAELDRVLNDETLRKQIEEFLKRDIELPNDDSPRDAVRNKPWTPRIVEDGERPHCDPLDYMQASIDDPRLSHRDELFAASNLAPYVHPKRTGSFISSQLNLPPPQNAAEAKGQMALIAGHARLGYVTLEESDKLIGHLKTFIDAEGIVDLAPRVARLEAEAAARGDQPVAQVGVVIQGGLPVMPGTESLIMPDDVLAIEAVPDERNHTGESSASSGTDGSEPKDGDSN
jgi:hypothetical protein